MKRSTYAIGIISLAVSLFSSSAFANGATKVWLSSGSAHKVHKVSKSCAKAPRCATVRVNHKRVSAKVASRNRIQRAKRLERAQRIARPNKRIAKRVYKTRYHTVVRGQNLYEISKKYGVTVKHILHVNKLKSASIKVGCKLRI